jgi:hypothetical protein
MTRKNQLKSVEAHSGTRPSISKQPFKLKVFISWSGERGKLVAEALRYLLGNVIPTLDLWMSHSDMDKGKRWLEELATQLEETNIGIICLTRDNLQSPWLHYEAGALSKVKIPIVCTFLFDVESKEVSNPLSQWNNTKNEKEDLLKLIHDLNKAQKAHSLDKDRIETVFEWAWDEFDQRFKSIPDVADVKTPTKTTNEMFDEILGLLRDFDHRSESLSLAELIRGRYGSNNKELTLEEAFQLVPFLNANPHYAFLDSFGSGTFRMMDRRTGVIQIIELTTPSATIVEEETNSNANDNDNIIGSDPTSS